MFETSRFHASIPTSPAFFACWASSSLNGIPKQLGDRHLLSSRGGIFKHGRSQDMSLCQEILR